MFCRQPRSLHLIVRAIVVVAGLAVALPAVSAPEPPGYAEIFTRAFSPDFSATVDDALLGEGPRLVTVYFKVIDLGRLKITSGHIVAADPFIGTNNAAFTQKVPT